MKRGRGKSPEARVSMKQGNVKVEAFCRLDQVSECVQKLKAALEPIATEQEEEKESRKEEDDAAKGED